MITIFYEIGPEHRSQVRVLRDRSHRQIKIIKEVLRKKKGRRRRRKLRATFSSVFLMYATGSRDKLDKRAAHILVFM